MPSSARRNDDVDIPKPAPRIANGAWSEALSHRPRLLGPPGFLQARVEMYPHLYQEIREIDALVARGITHATDGLPEGEARRLIAETLKLLDHGVTDLHQDTWIWLTNVAFTYDFFHDHISPADRQRMIDWINPHLEGYRDDESAFHNSTPSKMLCYLRIAYATSGDNPKAQQFRDYAIGKLYEQRLVPVLQQFGQGGGWTECGWYQRHAVWHLVEAVELARRIEGYDGYQLAPRFYYQRLAYEMHQPYPVTAPDGTERFAVEGDGSDRYSPRVENTHMLRDVLAEYFRGSELSRYMANRQRWAKHPLTKTDELLYRPDQDQYPLPVETFPLAHLALGAGKLYARSDWTQDATWFRFECSDYWNGHQHFEVGNFEIFRRASLATESGDYEWGSPHAMNWYIRTIAHNCLLVHMPGETWGRMRDGARTEYFNDGGQTKKWHWPPADMETWLAAQGSFTRGRFLAYADQPEFMFVAADCAPAYIPEKLKVWTRQIVYLRPHTFVMLDRVRAAKPEYKKTWLLHSRLAPDIRGPWFSVEDGGGKLTVQRLLPEPAAVTAIEGYSYGGRTFDPEGEGHRSTHNRWRVEVSPIEPREEDLFLHVLTTDEPQEAELISGDGVVGARFGDAEVVFEGEAGGRLTLGGEEFLLPAEIRAGTYE